MKIPKPYLERVGAGIWRANLLTFLMVMAFGWFFGLLIGLYIDRVFGA